MKFIREIVFLSRIFNRIKKYFLKIREMILLKVLENTIKYLYNKECLNIRLDNNLEIENLCLPKFEIHLKVVSIKKDVEFDRGLKTFVKY